MQRSERAQHLEHAQQLIRTMQVKKRELIAVDDLENGEQNGRIKELIPLMEIGEARIMEHIRRLHPEKNPSKYRTMHSVSRVESQLVNRVISSVEQCE
jgi:hypothetical protein